MSTTARERSNTFVAPPVHVEIIIVRLHTVGNLNALKAVSGFWDCERWLVSPKTIVILN